MGYVSLPEGSCFFYLQDFHLSPFHSGSMIATNFTGTTGGPLHEFKGGNDPIGEEGSLQQQGVAAITDPCKT